MTKDRAKRIILALNIGSQESIWFFELCIEHFKLDTDEKREQFAIFCEMTQQEYSRIMNIIAMDDINGGGDDNPAQHSS